MTGTATPKPPRLLDQVSDALRVRHMSLRTEKAYIHWIRRYILFHEKRHPVDMGEKEVNAFLTHLAVERRVGAATQSQALCALLFLYRAVLGRDLGELEGLIRAKRRRRLPVVLTQAEVRTILSHLTGEDHLFLGLLYGTGMRLMEGQRLRVKDIDFALHQITVREGKGGKDRVAPLPESLDPALQRHLQAVKSLHARDRAEGYGVVVGSRPQAGTFRRRIGAGEGQNRATFEKDPAALHRAAMAFGEKPAARGQSSSARRHPPAARRSFGPALHTMAFAFPGSKLMPCRICCRPSRGFALCIDVDTEGA